MAAMAQQDLKNRVVEVNRLVLVTTLTANRERHIAKYDEAMAGYKEQLLKKVNSAFEAAKIDIVSKHKKAISTVEKLKDGDISRQQDSFTIIEGVSVNMPVPRSYVDAYDAAIDMAKWDVNDTLKLTAAEFTCFVRDQWDWKLGFEKLSLSYIGNAR